MSLKRILVAIALLPITMPFAAIHAIATWWHFTVSSGFYEACRQTAKRRDQFFNSLDEEQTP